MPGTEDGTAAIVRDFLAWLDAGGTAPLAQLDPAASFSVEEEGALHALDLASWLAMARARPPGGERNAREMHGNDEVASFRIDTRLGPRTCTDTLLLRRGADGWRIASIWSYWM
jgi:hypothetical protein